MDVNGIQTSGGLKVTDIKPGNLSKNDPKKTGESTFSKALDALSESELGSDALIQKLAEGEDVDVHQVMIATAETDVNFRVALSIRDKLVEAYKEVMRMGV